MTYTATARTTESSVFHHSLTVDPRLTITSASIQQPDGAERLARSARIGNRLVLYLKDANLSQDQTQANVQNITIQAVLPLPTTRTVVVPQLGFEDAQTTSRTLSLYHSPQIEVVIEEAGRLTRTDETAPTNPTGSTDDSRQLLAGRFDLPDDSKPVSLRIRRRSLPTPLQIVYRLQPNPAGPWLLETRVMPLPGDRLNGPLQIQVESALLAVNGTENPIRWQAEPDSQSIQNGRLEAVYRNVTDVSLDAVLPDVPNTDRWTPPLPIASGRQVQQRLLLLSDDVNWVPDGAVTRLDAWPDSLSQDLFDPNAHATLWRLDGPNWSLARKTSEPTSPSAESDAATTATADRPTRHDRPATTVLNNTRTTSAWWIAWQVLASITLTTLIARGLPRVEHVRSQHWKPHHDRIAWLLVGLVSWFAATAGALGFGLAATMATLLLADKLRRQTRQAHAANPAP